MEVAEDFQPHAIKLVVADEEEDVAWIPDWEVSELGFVGNDTSANATDELEDESGRNEDVAKWEMALLAVMLCSAIVGNAIVLVALGIRRQRLTRMYFFMVHLCVADLTVAFFHILPQLCWEITYRFRGNNFLCKATKFLQLLGPYLSSYVLVATAVDRYRAVCFPLAQPSWTVRHARAAVWAAWIISLVFAVPQLFIFSYRQIPGSHDWDCWGEFAQPYGEKAYITWYTLANTLVPLAVLLYTYTAICWAVWLNFRVKKAGPGRRQTSTPPSEIKLSTSYTSTLKDLRTGRGKEEEEEEEASVDPPRIHSMQGISRAKIKTVKLTIVVIACYMVASMPYTCAMLWTVYTPDAARSAFYASPWYALLTLLASLNSCVNPWVYLFFNTSLLRIVQTALGCPWRPCRASPCCCPAAQDDQGRLRRIPANNIVPFQRSSMSDTSLMQTSTRSNVKSKGLLCAALTRQITGKSGNGGSGTGTPLSSPARTLAQPVVNCAQLQQPPPPPQLPTPNPKPRSGLANSTSESALLKKSANCVVIPRVSASAPTIACQGAHVPTGNGKCACEPV